MNTTDTIQLHEICGYLPYGLKVMHNERIIDVHGIICNDIFNLEEGDIPMYTVKPILRSLESMTEDEQLEIFGPDPEGHTGMWFDGVWALFSKYQDAIDIHYKLLSKHFDLSNLIPRSLAIDIKTLTP